MKNYEINLLISPDLSEEEVRLLSEKVASFINNEGGNLIESKSPLKIRVGYPIKKKKEAYFITFVLSLESEKLKSFEKKLKEEGQILRYLITKKEPAKEIIRTKVMPPREVLREVPKPEKKVELEEIEEKLEEILNE